MSTILITGANRGIGLEFARQYADHGWTVIGTARDVEGADTLRGTGAEAFALDVADPDSIDTFLTAIGSRPLDVFIANAGVIGPRHFDPKGWAETLLVNTIAPTRLAVALKPNVQAGNQRKMVAITSELGSIAGNASGGMLAYRSAKAALNAAWRTLAIEWRDEDLSLAMLHPGWVQTDMGGANAAITPEASVTGMRQVIAALVPEQSGGFLNYRGESLEW